MTKTFYTERDIEDLFQRGVISININDDVVLTELAFEKAAKLGVDLVRERQDSSQPGFNFTKSKPATSGTQSDLGVPLPVIQSSRRQKIKAAVIAKLGGEVDPKLLDTIINRVSEDLGIK